MLQPDALLQLPQRHALPHYVCLCPSGTPSTCAGSPLPCLLVNLTSPALHRMPSRMYGAHIRATEGPSPLDPELLLDPSFAAWCSPGPPPRNRASPAGASHNSGSGAAAEGGVTHDSDEGLMYVIGTHTHCVLGAEFE